MEINWISIDQHMLPALATVLPTNTRFRDISLMKLSRYVAASPTITG